VAPKHGPTHDVPVPSQAGGLGGIRPVVSLQATRTATRWVISVRGPAGPLTLEVEEARLIARGLLRACDDAERLT